VPVFKFSLGGKHQRGISPCRLPHGTLTYSGREGRENEEENGPTFVVLLKLAVELWNSWAEWIFHQSLVRLCFTPLTFHLLLANCAGTPTSSNKRIYTITKKT